MILKVTRSFDIIEAQRALIC